MPDAKKPPAKAREYEVLVSFSALNKGDRFTDAATPDDGWAAGHVQSGYLREVTEGVPDAGRSEVGQG